MRFILFFVALHSFSVFSQWQTIPLEEFRNEIVKLEKELINRSSISYTADMVIYTSHENKDTLSASRTTYHFNVRQKLMNLNHLGNFVVQDDRHQIVIDSLNKIIMLLDHKEDYFKHKQLLDFETLLKSECKAEKLKSAASGSSYKLIFPSVFAFESVELHFDSKNQLKKYVIFSTQEMLDNRDWKNAIKIKPRLEITVSDYKYDQALAKVKLKKIEDFVKDINLMQLTALYKDFEFVDMRTKTLQDGSIKNK